MNEVEPGQIWAGHYRIEAKLGEGGMAVVYRVYDLQRRVSLALKLLKPDYAEDTAFVEKFKGEARKLQHLQHPNIVRFYEFVDDGSQVFLLLELIEGPTLRTLLRQLGRPFLPGEILAYLRPVCAALSYAHSERTIHCDMKPANVMVDRSARVVVNDFGIARLSESATVTFSTPGTAAYMAPEQWRGGEDVFPATDIYALGVMISELLTGRHPFRGETAPTKGHNREKIMWEHLYGEAPRPSDLNPAIPAAIDAVVVRCLAKDWRERYQTADELLEAFSAACQAAGLSEVPVAIPQVGTWAGGGSATKPRGEVSSGIGGTQPSRPTEIGTTAPARPGGYNPALGSFRGPALVVVGLGVVVILIVGGFALLGGGNVSPPQSTTTATGSVITQVVITAVVTTTPNPSIAPSPSAASDTATAPLPTLSPTETSFPTTMPIPTATAAVGPAGKIVFTCNSGGTDQLCLIKADGTGRTQVSSGGLGHRDPTFSHDGRTIVYDCQVGSSQYEICRINVDGSGQAQFTHNGVESIMPVYSPDDMSIAYATNFGAAGEFPYGIWVMNSDGSNARQITTQASNADPAWSPDGRYVSYASTLTGGLQLWIANNDGSNPRQFTNGLGVQQRHSWAPDLRHLAIAKGPKNDWNIYLISPDGTGLQQLTFGGNNDRPSFSPDGGWIAFTSRRTGNSQIYEMHADGGQVTRLTQDPTSIDSQPYWGP